MKKIEVVPYDPNWPQQFENEAVQIKEVLGANCLAVHHVGSTSVPGLVAKPKIDIVVVVKSPKETIEKLGKIGFDYRGEYNIPMHYGFSKRDKVEVNLHVYEEGHPEIELNLTFRNYLRENKDVRDEYAALKLGLLKQSTSFEKNNSMFTGYNLGKDAFIRKVLKLANFNRLRFLKCVHLEEWESVRKFHPNLSEEVRNHPHHHHLILNQGVEIIGYAHIELLPKSKPVMRFFIVEKKEFEGRFLQWIETWLVENHFFS